MRTEGPAADQVSVLALEAGLEIDVKMVCIINGRVIAGQDIHCV